MMSSPLRIHALVLQGWRDDRCPAVDGIVFADGRIVLLDVGLDSIPNREFPEKLYAFRLRKNRVVDINTLQRDGELKWSHISKQFGSVDTARNLCGWCGETSWGSEGFVALATADTDQPIWIAIFDGSNPFKSVTLTTATVEAVSTYENVWSFPIESRKT
jgi:hypothetical protein